MPRTPRTGHSRTAVAIAALATAALGLTGGPAAASARVGAPARVSAEQVLYSFGGTDGAGPLAGLTAGIGGVLYGTTVFGGRHGDGCVFSLTPTGSGYTERVLFSFGGADGDKPGGTVVAGAHGDLFGETIIGGANDGGTVFELVPAGAGYTERVLHSFAGGADGLQPVGSIVADAHGDISGVTQFGGTGGQGVVYELRSTPGGYTERILHSFASTGGQPQAGLAVARNGTLYGTLYGASQVNPDGTVFSVRPRKAGTVYTDVYNFKGGTDGATPFAAVTVDNRTGVIYGTTQFGGGAGGGTVFSLTPSGAGYTERVLHAFGLGKDGSAPEAPVLINASGGLAGTATFGGTGCAGTGCGVVFELTPAGAAFHVLYRFAGPPDGAEPEWSGLAAGAGGVLFGTTRSGGTRRSCADGGTGGVKGCGTVYKITA